MSRPVGVALAVIALAPALAGCIGSGSDDADAAGPAGGAFVRDPAEVWPLLSSIVSDKVVKEHAPIASFDGTSIDSWVYRPEMPEGAKVPVIINFSPYWGNLAPPAQEEGDAFSRYLIDYYVPRGYAVVLSSNRGTGESDGCFDLGGDIEKKDAVAVIEHFASQPWSNGHVAAAGKSYDGTTPQGAATLTPPALKAMIPVSPISELYKYNYKGGLPYGGLHGASFNARYVALVGWGAFPTDSGPGLKPGDACAEFVPIAGHGLLSAVTGDYGDYWQERDYSKDAGAATAALFYIHGFQDWNVKSDHVLPWLDSYAGPKRVWLHQWEQPGDRGSEGGHVYPFRQDWNYTMLRFLDETLKGVETGFFDEPTYQIHDTAGAWRHETTWPPENAVATRFYLTGAGGTMGALSAAPGDGAAAAFRDDGMHAALDDPGRGTQLLYATDALSEEMRIAGVPTLYATAASASAAGKLAVTLYNVAPSGEAKVIDWGGLNLRHRDDVRSPQPVEPMAPYALRIEMFPQDIVVPAGHRLVLAIAGNAGWPGSGYGQFETLPTGAMITVTEDETAYLELPLQGAAAITYESPQPEEAGYCWAC